MAAPAGIPSMVDVKLYLLTPLVTTPIPSELKVMPLFVVSLPAIAGFAADPCGSSTCPWPSVKVPFGFVVPIPTLPPIMKTFVLNVTPAAVVVMELTVMVETPIMSKVAVFRFCVAVWLPRWSPVPVRFVSPEPSP